MNLLSDAEALAGELSALRRELHQIPEVGLLLPQTQARILEALEGLDLEITTGESTTSVVAVLRGGQPGPAVLLRGDMDALPVTEQNDLEYRSTNGSMHACGHDLHVAGLVGAARLLAARREEIKGSVIFMFQPGEETCGGARYMLEEGLLEAAGVPVVAACAIHVFPGELGQLQYKTGPAMASANELHVTFHGRGGHGSKPSTAIDPVPALLDYGSQLQVMVTRRFNVFDPVVASITRLSAGEAINVIPPEASLSATVRTLSDESIAAFRQEATHLAESIAAAHHCTATVDFDEQYPVTVNDGPQTEQAAAWAAELLGAENVVEVPTPLMGSEDFSFVAREVPGTFLFLACSPPGTDLETAAYNHSPLVLFDDAVLPRQAALLADFAIRRLDQEA